MSQPPKRTSITEEPAAAGADNGTPAAKGQAGAPTFTNPVRLSYRVPMALKARFDGLAAFSGETPDARIARLMQADIDANLPKPTSATQP